MPQPKKVRKPPRVVFSLGVPMPIERAVTRAAGKQRITRNEWIVRAMSEKLAREDAAPESAAA